MAKTVRVIEVVIAAKDLFSRTLKSALGKARAGFNALKKVIKIAAVAVAAFGAAMIAMAVSTANAGDEMQKMALRTGLSTEALSEFKHALEISGTSIEIFEKGMKTLSKRISDARFGLQSYVRIFEQLNIDYQDSQGNLREVDDVFLDIVDSINKLSTDTEKAALAQELLGKAGTQLLPLIKEGKDGIEALRKEARELGIVFTDLEANQAAAFNDEFLRLKSSVKGLWQEIGKELIPIFTPLFKQMKDFIINSEGLATAIDKVGAAFERFAGKFFDLRAPLEIIGDMRIELENLRIIQARLADEEDNILSKDFISRTVLYGGALKRVTSHVIENAGQMAVLITEIRAAELAYIDSNTALVENTEARDLNTASAEKAILAAKLAAEELPLADPATDVGLTREKAIADLRIAIAKRTGDTRLQIEGAVAGKLASIADSLFVIMGSKGKTALKVVQGFAIADAVIKGYQAAVAAWASGMSIGGPPVAAVFTAASLAKTGALIAKIGGSQGGDVGTSPTPTPSIGLTPLALAPAQEIQPAPVTININTATGDISDDLVDRIVDGINGGGKRNIFINFAEAIV